jgi:hypothetical protein
VGADAPPADSTAAVVDATAHSRNNLLLRVAFVLYITALAGLCAWQRRTLFAWPAGIVTGNLLASAIWAPLAVIHLDRLHRKNHREHVALLHRQHSEQMAVLHRHHGEQLDALRGGRPAGAERVTRYPGWPPRKDST